MQTLLEVNLAEAGSGGQKADEQNSAQTDLPHGS
jgi:hypothetical protein